MSARGNRLGESASPYLRQHDHQDIAWQEWTDEVLRAAREEDRPLFISIGYATCHWCHVMSHETFDNPDVAYALNNSFVAIKIDRQERPDLDHYFMSACMAMGRPGGWPLTVIAFPDGRPFYVATYMPPHSSSGRVGLLDVLNRVQLLWSTSREALEGTASDIHERLNPALATEPSIASSVTGSTVDRLIQQALDQLKKSFDAVNGGFGGAPKFPTFQHLRFLLRLGPGPAKMVTKTLDRIMRGGIYDHVGGGLHRYATDEDWHEPHFEKMLHDQAGLLRVLAERHAALGASDDPQRIDQLLDTLESSFMAPDGTFYAAWDADSEGEEGRYYMWTRSDLEQALSADDAAFVAERMGVGPNGPSILDLNRSHGSEPMDASSVHRLRGILDCLAVARDERTPPFRDENVLVDWNGMVLGALASASRYAGSDKALEMAIRLGTALRDRFITPDGLLRRGFLDETGIDAQLDDYAWVVDGYLELTQVSGQSQWLHLAQSLMDEAIERLWDPDRGTFVLSTSANVPRRLPRLYDEAYESGVAIMQRNLNVLTALQPNPSMEKIRDSLTQTLMRAAETVPTGLIGFLAVLLEERTGRGQIRAGGNANSITDRAKRLFAPDLFLLHGEMAEYDSSGKTDELPEGHIQVCRNQTCDLPVKQVEDYRMRPFRMRS